MLIDIVAPPNNAALNCEEWYVLCCTESDMLLLYRSWYDRDGKERGRRRRRAWCRVDYGEEVEKVIGVKAKDSGRLQR